ncbi:MAG: LysM peptidoglycan-binding domain-containing protein [Solirubrobacteraceae bacterium]
MSRAAAARIAAPLAFLLAVTIVVLLVRAGLREGEGSAGSGAVVAVTSGEQVYVVRKGDTLEEIAARFGTTSRELQRLNPGVDPVELRVGLRLRVK